MNSLNGCWRVMPALGVLIVMGNTYATAEAGCTDSKTVRAPTDVTTDMCPVAVAGFDYTATVGDEVMLDARGSYDLDGDGLQYAWSLVGIPEDSLAEITRINGFDGVFTIDVPGLYIAEVTVTDARGNQSSDRIKIDTSNSAPVAHAGQDLAVVAGEYVELDGTGSGDFDNDPIGYAWKLSRPADSSAALAGANTATPGFAVDVAGEYTAHLVVRDDRGHTAHDDVRISTVNTAPVAHPGWGGRVRLGSTMTLDARASSDVDGDALAYRWSVLTAPADSARQLRNAATPEASLALDAAGHYLLQLLVDDGQLLSEPVILAVEAAENAPPPLSDSQRDVLQRAGGGGPDSDGDGVPNAADNCVNVANPNQRDTDGDGIGNFCDPDFNNDGTVNFADLSIMKANFFSAGDIDTDLNGDGFTNFIDLTILKNFFFGPPGPPGTLTWINGAGGNWNVATNWSPTALPAEGVTAIINLDPDVTVTIGPGVVAEVGDLLLDDNLVLDGGTLDGATVIGAGNVNVTNDSVIDGITMEATMSIENGDIVTVRNNLVVNGSITINGFSLGTGLEFDGSQTLAGSGGIVFNTNFNGTLSEPRVRPIAGATLTIGDGLTISGNNGTVGNPDGGLVMNGVVRSTFASSQIAIRGNSIAIGGTLAAENNGTLHVGDVITSVGPGMTIDNPVGNIFFGGTPVGGSVALGPAILDGTPGSKVTLPSGLASFDTVEANVDLILQNGSVISVSNGLTLNNTTTLQGTSIGTGFDFVGTQALDGTATIVFATNFNGSLGEPRVRPVTPASTLTIGPGITITGNNGTVGDADASTVIQGSVLVDTTSSTRLVRGAPVIIEGSLTASAGTMRLLGNVQTPPAGAAVDSNGGSLRIGGSGLGSQSVGPATFNGAPGTTIVVEAGTHTLNNTSFNTDLVMLNGALAIVTNNLEISGEVSIQGTSLGTGFDFDGTQTFSGSANISFDTNFNGALAEPRVRPINGELTIGPNIDFFGGNGSIGNPALKTNLGGDVTVTIGNSEILIHGTNSTIAGALATTQANARVRLKGSFDNGIAVKGGNGIVPVNTVTGTLFLDQVAVTDTSFNAINGSNVQVTTADATFDSVTMDGVNLTLVNGAIVSITNNLFFNGDLFINGTSVPTGLEFDGGIQSFSGSGTVEFLSNFNGAIAEPHVSPVNGGDLTIGAGITIRGNNGLVGTTTVEQGSTNILGPIIADTGSEMWIGGDFSMTGQLTANGMNARLIGQLDNAGLALPFDSQSGNVTLGGAGFTFSASNASFNGTGNSIMTVPTTDATFDNVSINSVDMSLQNGAIVTVSNGMTFNGIGRIKGTSVGTGFLFTGTQTLAGTASLIFESNFNGQVSEPIVGPVAGGTLTIGPNIAISGNNGTVGGTGGTTILQGSVTASNGSLVEVGGTMQISGSLQVDAGVMRLIGSIDNAGQAFNLNSVAGDLVFGGNGSSVTVNNATINAAAGSSATVTSQDATFNGVTIAGDLDLTLQNGAIVTAQNGFTMNGIARIVGTSISTGFQFDGTQTFGGNADVIFQANFNGQIAEPQVRPTSGTLTIGPGINISGDRGTVGDLLLPLIVQGSIAPSVNSAIFDINGSSVTNNGVIGTGPNPVTTVTVSALSDASTGLLRVERGTLRIDSNFGAGGTVESHVDGATAFGLLDVIGVGDFSNATLAIDRDPVFTPGLGSSFEIVNYASLAGSGQFGTVTGTDAGNGNTFVPGYNATDVTLTVN